MLTLHGTLDSLLPPATDSDMYRNMVVGAGRKRLHRYYVIENGNHADGLHNEYSERLRPMLPCVRAAFTALVRWVEEGVKPPRTTFVPKLEKGDVNRCAIGNIRYRPEKGWS